MRVPVLFAPVPHCVAHRAAAAAAGAALGVAARVAAGAPADAAADAAAGCDDAIGGAEAVGVPCWPHPARATASVAVSTGASAPRFAILRETPMNGSFDDPRAPYGRRTGSTG
jgi:hypothetical protein